MGIFDYLNQLNYNVVRRKIFRREVEHFIYSNKKFPLPKVKYLIKEDLSAYKKIYPFNFYLNEAAVNSSAELLSEMEDETSIIMEAENILQNKYNILNSGELYLGDEINWHYDYKVHYRWHEVLVWRENFFKFPKGADIKFPWELARFHQGIKLGKAFLLTQDEKYVEKFLHLFQSFNEKNPFCIGVNWTASNEAAIRIVNLFFAIALFFPSPNINSFFLNEFHQIILQHAVFIENNLFYSKYKGHEYLSNLLGLAAAGLLFKDSSYGKKNLQFAYSEFEQEIRTQIFKDGVSYEQSIPFHSFILEHFYLAKLIIEKTGYKFTDEYNKRLKSMFHVQDNYLRDDHSIPQIGDSISSRVIPFNTKSDNNFSYPLAVAKFLYNDVNIKHSVKPTAELLFLFGEKSVKGFKPRNEEKFFFSSSAFEKGGHYILQNKDVHFFVEAGEIGRNGGGAPGHNDTFTYELFYKQKLMITDSGTYSYYADPDLRNFLRSVKAHNTFYIDNLQLAEFEDLFKVKDDLTKPKVIQWETNDVEDILTAQHYAYARLQDPVICKRSFNFLKERGEIKIRDEFFGGTVHEIVSNIHFHPDVQLKEISQNKFTAVSGSTRLELNFSSLSKFFAVNIFDSQYSPSYGIIQKSKKLNIILKDKFPVFINVEISLL